MLITYQRIDRTRTRLDRAAHTLRSASGRLPTSEQAALLDQSALYGGFLDDVDAGRADPSLAPIAEMFAAVEQFCALVEDGLQEIAR